MLVSRTTARAGRRISDQRGQALVEFALLAPLLLLVLIGVIQFGVWLFSDVDLTSATREGGRLLASSKNDTNALQDVKNRVAQNLDPGIDPSQLQITVSPAPASSTPLWPVGTTVTLTVAYPDQLNVMGVPLGDKNMTASAQVMVQ